MEAILKKIIAKSPASTSEAMQALKAIGSKSPMTQIRYNRAVETALSDESANFTAGEREEMSSLLVYPSDSRFVTIGVRFSEEERAEIQARADAEGLKMSAWIRKRLLE